MRSNRAGCTKENDLPKGGSFSLDAPRNSNARLQYLLRKFLSCVSLRLRLRSSACLKRKQPKSCFLFCTTLRRIADLCISWSFVEAISRQSSYSAAFFSALHFAESRRVYYPVRFMYTFCTWRGAGVVELAALEKRYGATHRGFESLPLRHE